MPEQLDPEQIQDYLGKLAGSAASPSRSSFKHTVYGLRFYFKLIGLPKRLIDLPSIRAKHKLPTVLSKEECKLLFKTPLLLKHRLALCFIYSTGLRVSEFSNIKIGDVDFDRMMVQNILLPSSQPAACYKMYYAWTTGNQKRKTGKEKLEIDLQREIKF